MILYHQFVLFLPFIDRWKEEKDGDDSVVECDMNKKEKLVEYENVRVQSVVNEETEKVCDDNMDDTDDAKREKDDESSCGQTTGFENLALEVEEK